MCPYLVPVQCTIHRWLDPRSTIAMLPSDLFSLQAKRLPVMPPPPLLSLQTKRLPVMTKYLTLEQAGLVLKRAFVSPVPGAPAMSEVGGEGEAHAQGCNDDDDEAGWRIRAGEVPPRC